MLKKLINNNNLRLIFFTLLVFTFFVATAVRSEPIFLLCNMKGLYKDNSKEKKLDNVQIVIKLIIGKDDIEKIYGSSFKNSDVMVIFDTIYAGNVWVIKDHKIKSEMMDINDNIIMTDHTISGGGIRIDKKPLQSFSQTNFEIDRYSGIFSFSKMSSSRLMDVSSQQILNMNGKCDLQENQTKIF